MKKWERFITMSLQSTLLITMMTSNGGGGVGGSNIGQVFILYLNPHFHSMNLGPTITHVKDKYTEVERE